MFSAVQPRVGVGIGLVTPFHCGGSLGVFPLEHFNLGAQKRAFQCILNDHLSLSSALLSRLVLATKNNE